MTNLCVRCALHEAVDSHGFCSDCLAHMKFLNEQLRVGSRHRVFTVDYPLDAGLLDVSNPPRYGSSLRDRPRMMHYLRYYQPMNQLQDAVSAWQARTFGEQPPEAFLVRLVQELRELIEDPHNIDEAADILILLLGWAAAAGYTVDNLEEAAWRKHSINTQRTWVQAEDGTWHHE